MAARFHVCPLGALELEGVTTAAFADLDKHSPGLLIDDAWHTILVLQLTLRPAPDPTELGTMRS